MNETAKTAAAKEKQSAVNQKGPSEPEIKANRPLMYVGPTIPGLATQNTVYTQISEPMKEAAKDCPIVLDLFIPVMDYPKAEQQIRNTSGRLYTAFCKAMSLRKKRR